MKKTHTRNTKAPGKAAYSVSLTVCDCGCGMVRLYLHDTKDKVFASAHLNPDQIHNMFDVATETTEAIRAVIVAEQTIANDTVH